MPLWNFFTTGGKRAVAVWHRRAGKDSLALNWTVVAAHQRIGTYWHMLPTANQARKVIWNGVDREGRRMIDQAFPKAIRKRTQNTEMLIEFKNGSFWQAVGSDNYDALIGANPVGVIHSEYSVANPKARVYLNPILRENGGWQLFIYTPRGRNHGSRLYDMALTNENWFCEMLIAYNEGGKLPKGTRATNALTPGDIQEERAEGMDEDDIQQEYFCSFDAAIKGSYYGRIINQLDKQGQLVENLYDPLLEVHTFWDLGMDDAMSIWFVQIHGKEQRVIDYYENSGEGLKHYVNVLRGNQEGHYHMSDYMYGTHTFPHDGAVRELGTGVSRQETMKSLGVKVKIARKLDRMDGIQAVRTILPTCWFDKVRCERGLDGMRQYQKEWDEKRSVFKTTPLHDWASNPADAFRTFAVSKPKTKRDKRRYKPQQSWVT